MRSLLLTQLLDSQKKLQPPQHKFGAMDLLGLTLELLRSQVDQGIHVHTYLLLVRSGILPGSSQTAELNTPQESL